MRETWYIMKDGSLGDPREISEDANGVLKHSDGRAVDYAPHGPRTRGVDVDASAGKPLFGGKGDHDGNGKAGGAVVAADRELKPAKKPAAKKKPGYKTREG